MVDIICETMVKAGGIMGNLEGFLNDPRRMVGPRLQGGEE